MTLLGVGLGAGSVPCNSIMSVHVFGQLISRLKNTGSPSERKGEVISW